jgi:hypothetical protein
MDCIAATLTQANLYSNPKTVNPNTQNFCDSSLRMMVQHDLETPQ